MAATIPRATAPESIFCFSYGLINKLTGKQAPSAEKHTARLLEKIPAILRGDSEKLEAIAVQPDANHPPYRKFRRYSIQHPEILMLLNPLELSQITPVDEISKLFDLKQPRGIFAAQLQKIIANDASKKGLILPAIKKIMTQGEVQRNLMLEELVQIATWEQLSDIIPKLYLTFTTSEQSKLLNGLFKHFKDTPFLFDVFEVFFKEDAVGQKKEDFLRNKTLTTDFIGMILHHFLENGFTQIARNLKSGKNTDQVDPNNAQEKAIKVLDILKNSEIIKPLAQSCSNVLKALFENDPQEYKEMMSRALNNFIFLRGVSPFFSQYPVKNKKYPVEKWSSFAQFLQYCLSGNPYSLENREGSELSYRTEMNTKLKTLQPKFDQLFKSLIN